MESGPVDMAGGVEVYNSSFYSMQNKDMLTINRTLIYVILKSVE